MIYGVIIGYGDLCMVNILLVLVVELLYYLYIYYGCGLGCYLDLVEICVVLVVCLVLLVCGMFGVSVLLLEGLVMLL